MCSCDVCICSTLNEQKSSNSNRSTRSIATIQINNMKKKLTKQDKGLCSWPRCKKKYLLSGLCLYHFIATTERIKERTAKSTLSFPYYGCLHNNNNYNNSYHCDTVCYLLRRLSRLICYTLSSSVLVGYSSSSCLINSLIVWVSNH